MVHIKKHLSKKKKKENDYKFLTYQIFLDQGSANFQAQLDVCFLFFFFGHFAQLVGSQFSDQGLNSGPWQRKCRVLTTGPLLFKIKLYGIMATIIHLCIVYGCLCVTATEFGLRHRDCETLKVQNVYFLGLYKKKKSWLVFVLGDQADNLNTQQ